MDVGGKKVVVIFLPFPQLKSFQKIQVSFNLLKNNRVNKLKAVKQRGAVVIQLMSVLLSEANQT